MTISVEMLLVASLMMAVFAAVSVVGSSLFLGAGFERLRAGFEKIKNQTAFFADALYKLDGRVEKVEKQSGYFFDSIHRLEQQDHDVSERDQPENEPVKSYHITADPITESDEMQESSLPSWGSEATENTHFH